jgi:hypothetical protein
MDKVQKHNSFNGIYSYKSFVCCKILFTSILKGICLPESIDNVDNVNKYGL